MSTSTPGTRLTNAVLRGASKYRARRGGPRPGNGSGQCVLERSRAWVPAVAEGMPTVALDGQTYLLERALRGDLALLRADRADRAGNCWW